MRRYAVVVAVAVCVSCGAPSPASPSGNGRSTSAPVTAAAVISPPPPTAATVPVTSVRRSLEELQALMSTVMAGGWLPAGGTARIYTGRVDEQHGVVVVDVGDLSPAVVDAAAAAFGDVVVVDDGGTVDVRWVAINAVSATGPDATSLRVGLDACTDVPPAVVVETGEVVHVRIDREHDDNGPQLACGGGTVIELAGPIGDRRVVDDRTGRTFEVVWNPPVTIPHRSGSVAELLAAGEDADATVTGWLIVDRSGSAVLCDDLPADATSCPAPVIDVDWATGGATPPSGLVARGGVQVSAGPVTLRGSLKENILYVGVIP